MLSNLSAISDILILNLEQSLFSSISGVIISSETIIAGFFNNLANVSLGYIYSAE